MEIAISAISVKSTATAVRVGTEQAPGSIPSKPVTATSLAACWIARALLWLEQTKSLSHLEERSSWIWRSSLALSYWLTGISYFRFLA